MLNGLLKKAGILPNDKKEVDMSVEDKAPTVELAQHEAMVAEFTALQGQMADVLATVESMKTELEAAVAAKAAVEAQLAEIEAAAKTELQAERTAKLVALAGEEKAAAVMATMSDASNETFEAVMGAMAASYAAEEKSDLFVEKGLDTKPAPVAEKDVATRLAENIATQLKTVK